MNLPKIYIVALLCLHFANFATPVTENFVEKSVSYFIWSENCELYTESIFSPFYRGSDRPTGVGVVIRPSACMILSDPIQDRHLGKGLNRTMKHFAFSPV